MSFPHEAIIERLDWTQKKDGYEHYYPVDEFEKSLDTFDQIPVILANRHPPLGVRGRDLKEVLTEINGVEAGYVSRPMINNMGRPKLAAVLNIVDSAVEDRIKSGEVSISSAFTHDKVVSGALTGICGDHVLLYDSKLGIPQGDPGAIICNQANHEIQFKTSLGNFTGDSMPNEQDLSTIATILKTNQDEFNNKFLDQEKKLLKLNTDLETATKTIDELTQNQEKHIQDIEAAHKTALSEKDTAISNLEATITANQSKIAELEKIINDTKQQTIKDNQDRIWTNLPEGIKSQFKERKAELDAEFDESKMNKFNQDIGLALIGIHIPDLKNADGKEYSTNQNEQSGLTTDGKTPLMRYDLASGRMVKC